MVTRRAIAQPDQASSAITLSTHDRTPPAEKACTPEIYNVINIALWSDPKPNYNGRQYNLSYLIFLMAKQGPTMELSRKIEV